MADSMNKPEIETLSYKPASAPREVKEKTTLDIEPKTENKENIGQQPKMISKEEIDLGDGVKMIGEFVDEQPKLRLCKKCQVVNCSCRAVILKEPEQPNQQLMLIQAIQGLTACILNSITKLPESELKDQAYDDMNIFETSILFKLQKEYE